MAGTPSLFAGIGGQLFDNNGNPLSGGKVFTYLGGTTTPVATYTTESASVAHTNPIILDSAGRVPSGGEIWLNDGDGTSYKFVVKTSTDVVIATYDNVPGTYSSGDLANTTDVNKGDALVGFRQSSIAGLYTGAVGRTVHDKLQEWVSIRDFGAVGDGSTNDTAAIQAAIDAVATGAGSGVVYIPAGTYLIDTNTAISVPSNVIIQGSGMKSILKKISGTADIFTTTGNNTQFLDFRMEGPNNTGCDGITLNAGATECVIKNIEGYQLASTVTCGVTSRVYDVLIENVVSRNNTQQGIHCNIVSRCSVRSCKSFDIGSSSLHHGIYIGQSTDLVLDDFYAEGCFGFGVHAYAQGSGGIQKNLTLINLTVKGNGKDTSGTTRGGLFVGSDGIAQTSYVSVENLYAEGNAVYNVAVDGAWNFLKFNGMNLIGTGAFATTQGVFVGSTFAGDRSITIRDFTISDHSSSGLRIAISTATIKNFDIDQGQIINNGIFATGTSVVSTISLGDNIYYDNAPINGTFLGRRNGTNFKAVAQSITATYTFDKNGPNVLLLNPSGGSQYVYANPGTAPLPAGWLAFVKHTGASNVLYFDPYGINVALNPGQNGIFAWSGSAWAQIA